MFTLRLVNVFVFKHSWICNFTSDGHIGINITYDRANSIDHITQQIAWGISSTHEKIDGGIELYGAFIGGKYFQFLHSSK